MHRAAFGLPGVACAAVVLALAAGALAQVKAQLPMVGLNNRPLPLQRSAPHRQLPGPGAPPIAVVPQSPPIFVPQQPVVVTPGVYYPPAYVQGSGLTVDGSYDSGNFNLDFHLGSNALVPVQRPVVIYPVGGYPYYSEPWGGWYTGWREYRRPYAIDGALVQGYTPPAPAPLPPAPAEAPETPEQQAQRAMRDGRMTEAVDLWRRVLRDAPANAEAMRSMAIALASQGDLTQGVAMMSMAYRTDPTLAERRVDRGVIFGDEGDLRREVRRLAVYANKTEAASAWLTLAVLMQAQGRDDNASRMIVKAREAGLDHEVATAMSSALE